MTFKTRPHAFTFDRAPTGRARCRKCRRIIACGAERVVIHAFVRPNRATHRMMHAACAETVLGAVGVEVHESMGSVKQDAAT